MSFDSDELELFELAQALDDLQKKENNLKQAMDAVKIRLREKQELMKEDIEIGGVHPLCEYPEYVNGEQITYLTAEDFKCRFDITSQFQ